MTSSSFTRVTRRRSGTLLLVLLLLAGLAVLSGGYLDLGWQFYVALPALLPVLLSAVVVYNSLLRGKLPLAWGYWVAPICVLMAWDHLSLTVSLLTQSHQPDALGSLIWLTLPIGHTLLLVTAAGLHLSGKALIDKYRRGSNHHSPN